jgi:hypothetical protein
MKIAIASRCKRGRQLPVRTNFPPDLSLTAALELFAQHVAALGG